MALFKICRGVETNLPTTLTSGYCYFCTDTTNFYIDYTDTYGALTRAKIASKYADKLRYTEDGNFMELDPIDIVTKSNYETAIGVATSDKNGLMSSSDKTKLDGVESGAQVNVQADYFQNDTTATDYIKNRTHHSEPYAAIPSAEPVDLLQRSIGDIIRLDNQAANGAIIVQVINSLGTRYGGVRAAIRETTYNTDFEKVHTHDWDCSDTTVTIEEIGHHPTYEWMCNKLCHIVRGSVELYVVYFIAYPAYLNDEYKTQFPKIGIYLKYIAKPVYASQYLNVSLVTTRYYSLSRHYLPQNVENTDNRVIAISAESDDTHYPTAKAVYDALPTIVSTDSNGLMSSVDKSKLDGISSGATAVSIDTTLTQSGQAADAKAVGDELAKKLDNPQTAAVGDVLTVEEVDSDGKPTKWKSVDANAVLTIDNRGYKGTDYYALPDGVYNLLSLYVGHKDGMNLRLQGVTSVKNHTFTCAGKNTIVIFGSDGSVVGYDYGVWRWNEKENVSNKVTSLSATSKDSQYPSAKAVYDTLTTAIPTTLPNPNKLTFSGAVTGEYDGSSTVAIEIPKGGKASANFLIQPNGTVLSAPTYAQLTSGAYASFYALYGGTLYALSQQTQTSGTFTFKFNDVPNGKMYVVTVDSSDNTTFAEEDLPTTTVTLKTWTSVDIS